MMGSQETSSEVELSDVESILAHRYADNSDSCEFLVRWMGYSDEFDTWEPLSSFLESLVAHNYVLDHSLQVGQTITPIAGTVLSEENIGEHYDDGELITANFHTIFYSLGQIYRLRKHQSFNSPLRVIHTFKSLPKEDTIVLFPYNHHLHVVYYRTGNNTSYVCDGANDSFGRNFLAEARKVFGSVRALKFHSQYGIDHCSPSGVLIALRFLQFSKNPSLLRQVRTISAPMQLRNRLVSKMCPAPTQRIPDQPEIGERAKKERRCIHCKKSFFKISLQALRCHERVCG